MGNGSTAGVARELFLKLSPWGVSSGVWVVIHG